MARLILLLALSGLVAAQDAVRLTNDASATGYLRVPGTPVLNPVELTVEARIRPLGPGLGNAASGAIIVINEPLEGGGGLFIASWGIWWAAASGTVSAFWRTGPGAGVILSSTTTIPIGSPTSSHVAFVLGPSQAALYVNGVEEASSPMGIASLVPLGSGDFLIGAANFASGYLRRFDGVIDEVRIWDQAATASEVASRAACAVTVPTAGLLARWSFDGQSLNDSGPSGLHAVAQLSGVSFAPSLVIGPCGQVTSLGVGCGGGPNPPTLTASPPVLGQSMSLSVTHGEPSSTGAVFVGTEASAPLVIAPGCAVYLDLQTLQLLLPIATDGSGVWSVSIPLPPTSTLAELQVALQATLIPTTAPLGLDLTNGLCVVLGY